MSVSCVCPLVSDTFVLPAPSLNTCAESMPSALAPGTAPVAIFGRPRSLLTVTVPSNGAGFAATTDWTSSSALT